MPTVSSALSNMNSVEAGRSALKKDAASEPAPAGAAADTRKIVTIAANRQLAQRTTASYTVILIFMLYAFVTPIFHEHTGTVMLFGTLVTLSVLFRVFIAKMGLRSEALLTSPAWMRNYWIATMVMGAAWTSFVIAVSVLYHTQWLFLLAVLCSVGIASAATTSLAPNGRLGRIYISSLVVPIVIVGILENSRASISLSVLLAIFVAAIIIMVRDNSKQFWTTLTTIEDLNVQKAELEKVISRIGENSGELKEASDSLSTISSRMSQGAETMSVESQRVAGAAADFNANSQTIAVAMQDLTGKTDNAARSISGMTDMINTIAQTTTNTKAIAGEAVRQAGSATAKVSELGNSAQEVGKITEAIKEISEQTNLLALNATIEAARAGEAGKGFSVVANEIKDLATQTADATLKIKQQIENIQRVIAETVAEIDQISRITHEIDESISASADTVAEQSATTKAIAAAVTDASREMTDLGGRVVSSSQSAETIANGITGVSQVANEVATNSVQVDASAEALMRLANALNEIVVSSQRV